MFSFMFQTLNVSVLFHTTGFNTVPSNEIYIRRMYVNCGQSAKRDHFILIKNVLVSFSHSYFPFTVKRFVFSHCSF